MRSFAFPPRNIDLTDDQGCKGFHCIDGDSDNALAPAKEDPDMYDGYIINITFVLH